MDVIFIGGIYMEISLALALPLRRTIESRIEELQNERLLNSKIEYEKGETYEKPARSFELITQELFETMEDYRLLDILIATNNITATISWDGKEISIMEAIELAKQLRHELMLLKSFALEKKQETIRYGNSHNGGEKTYLITLYDPEGIRKQAAKLEREVNRLSFEIERKNHSVEFKYSPAKKYI